MLAETEQPPEPRGPVDPKIPFELYAKLGRLLERLAELDPTRAGTEMYSGRWY